MILTIGAFDGFHRGHARLLEAARGMAGGDGDWGGVTFYPHPEVFLGGLRATLFTLRERELVRRALGVPHLFILRFDQEMRGLSPERFWARLSRTFTISGLVMGQDFHFGNGQAGTAALLETLCRRDGVRAAVVPLLKQKGVRLSSTEARQGIQSGDVRRAAEVLGYPWFLWSRVVHGLGRGHELGFPTANLDLSDAGSGAGSGKLLPAPGVYAAILPIQGRWRCGALSLGDNPTFGDIQGTRAEVFILDFDGGLYDADLPVLLLERLRPMRRFADAEALAEQIGRDVLRCREIGQGALDAQAEFLASFARCYGEMEAEGAFTPQIWGLAEC